MAGAETLLVRLAARQSTHGERVCVCSNAVSPATKVLGSRLDEVGVAWEELPIGGKFSPRSLVNLRQAARQAGATVLHSHLSSASWWCGWLDALGQVPSVGHVHGFTSALWHRRQRHLIAVSQAVKTDLVRQGVRDEKISVLPNPVDADDVQPQRESATVRAELGADKSTFVVGTFAHLSEKKGWRDLMAAVPQVLAQQPNVQFWWAGDGPLRPQLEQWVEQNNLQKQVRVLGFRRDVADLMNAMDVMVLPSHREPFGLVYVEAALLNKPSIACDAGGAPEVVLHNQTGLLVPPQAPERLAQAILQLAQNQTLAQHMGVAARENALSQFGWQKYLHGLNEVYQKVGA
jgi:glycosyltransferase involved in cell wall biosynthesis